MVPVLKFKSSKGETSTLIYKANLGILMLKQI